MRIVEFGKSGWWRVLYNAEMTRSMRAWLTSIFLGLVAVCVPAVGP
jgi:hypothetical protein